MLKKLLLAAVVVVGLALGGCSTSSILPPAPATPAVTDVLNEQTNLQKFTGQPQDYLNIGVEVSNAWCVSYLNALTQNASYLDFGASEATQLGALSTGISSAFGAGAPTTAVLGLLFPSLNQSLLAAGRMATAGADPGVVYNLVTKEHAAYLGGLTPPTTTQEAVADVSGYAAICQPAAIRSAVLQSGLNTVVSTQTTTGSTTPGAVKALPVDPNAPPAPHVNVPPVLVIGH